MLQNEEIREICVKHALTRKEVYQIRSEFASMCDDSEKMKAEMESGVSGDGLPDAVYSPKARTNTLQSPETVTDVNKPLGINVDYFIKYSQFLSGAIPSISKRILIAQGLDVESTGAMVNWQMFLDLYCIFEAGQVEKNHLIKFWIKFFDAKLEGVVKKADYEKLLE